MNLGSRVLSLSNLADRLSASHVTHREDVEAILSLAERFIPGENNHQRHGEQRGEDHHAKQVKHDVKVRVHTKAKKQVRILFNLGVRLGDAKSHLLAE